MELPGNRAHQKVIQALLKSFQSDPNIEAFILFGSLGRGDWDDYSDLDLDAVVKDNRRAVIINNYYEYYNSPDEY